MPRISGKAKRSIAVSVSVLALLAGVLFIAQRSKGPSAAPNTQTSVASLTRTPDNTIQSGLWTDKRGAAWIKEHKLFERKGQTFTFKAYERLTTAIPVSLAYYDTAVTEPMRPPTSIKVVDYYGDTPLTLPFPPLDAAQTCKYLVVLYVGLDQPRGSETPANGNLTSPSERVLYLADQTTDVELQERCNPSPSRVRPS